MPLIIEFAFMFTLLINVGNIVTEKQTKMKVIYFEIIIKFFLKFRSILKNKQGLPGNSWH